MKIWNKKLKTEALQCLLFFGVGTGLMIYSLYQHNHSNIDWVMSPYLFPLLISIFLMLLASNLAAKTVRNGRAEKEQEKTTQSSTAARGKLLLSLAGIAVYYLVMPYLGFIFSSLLFLAAMFWLLGERRWQMIALLSAGTTFALYGIFHQLLHVMLP